MLHRHIVGKGRIWGSKGTWPPQCFDPQLDLGLLPSLQVLPDSWQGPSAFKSSPRSMTAAPPEEEEEKKCHLIKENIKAELFVQQQASDGEIPSVGWGKSKGEGKR